MVRINGKVYSGEVMNNKEDSIVVVIYTAESLRDIAATLTEVSEITEFFGEEDGKIYNVTTPLSAKTISSNVYALEFSTKPTYEMEVKTELQKQSDAIDDLLVMILEG